MAAREAGFRSLDDASNLPDSYANPYYLKDERRRVTVARVAGALFAFDDFCPHQGCPLSSGLLSGKTLMCQCDGSLFDVTTGAVLRGPATRALQTYEVRESGGQIQVRI